MENLIKQLLDLDRRGRQLVEEAEGQRTRIGEAVRQSTRDIRDTLGDRADAHLERTRSAYGQTADERLSAAQADFDTRLARMESLYAGKKDEWVKMLVDRSLGRTV